MNLTEITKTVDTFLRERDSWESRLMTAILRELQEEYQWVDLTLADFDRVLPVFLFGMGYNPEQKFVALVTAAYRETALSEAKRFFGISPDFSVRLIPAPGEEE